MGLSVLVVGGYSVSVAVDELIHGDTMAMCAATFERLKTALKAESIRQFANAASERLKAREGVSDEPADPPPPVASDAQGKPAEPPPADPPPPSDPASAADDKTLLPVEAPGKEPADPPDSDGEPDLEHDTEASPQPVAVEGEGPK